MNAMCIEWMAQGVSEQVELFDYLLGCSDSGCFHRNQRKPKEQPLKAYTM
jgi:hypothetical protein